MKYSQSGEKRGAHRLSGGAFETDKAAESTLTDNQLRALAQTAGQEITYTAVPVAAGMRMGVDRDEDTVLDADDNCPAFANSGQEDDDSDGVGNSCEPPDTDGDGDGDGDGVADNIDNCTNAMNAAQIDTDADGHGNACDGDFENNCMTNIFDLFDFKVNFAGTDQEYDLDSTGGPVQVNIFDLFDFKGLFGSAPGPSAAGSLCNP